LETEYNCGEAGNGYFFTTEATEDTEGVLRSVGDIGFQNWKILKLKKNYFQSKLLKRELLGKKGKHNL